MLLKVEDLAEMFGVAKTTIYKWVKEDTIPYVKIGRKTIRFDREKVLEILGKK